MARKTIELKKIIEKANEYFLYSPQENSHERLTLQSFVTHLLQDVDNYTGFRYLVKDELNNKKIDLPGIIFDDSEKHDHKYPDISRISIHMPKV